jgi:hypothetical protein
MSPSAFFLTRAGQHLCYDRVVFDVNGSEPVGYVARYVPVVTADPSGAAVPVAGNAVLEVVLRAPADDGRGHQPGRPDARVGASLLPAGTVAAWRSLRSVTFAGSFEGQSTIAVGVRERRPFVVTVTAERGYRHVVVDIAH